MSHTLNQLSFFRLSSYLRCILFALVSLLFSYALKAEENNLVLIKQDAVSLHGNVAELEKSIETNSFLRKDIERNAKIELVMDQSHAKDPKYIEAATAKVQESLQRLGINSQKIKIKFIQVNWEQNLEEVGTSFTHFMQNNPSPDAYDQMVQKNRLAEQDPSLLAEEKVSKKIVHQFTETISSWYLGALYPSQYLLQTHPSQILKDGAKCTSVCVTNILKGIVHESRYIAGAYKRSIQKLDLLSSSVALATRIPSAVTSTVETVSGFAQAGASNIGLGIHLGVGLGLNFGHGIITPIWVNSQRLMVEERGKAYQATFDFAYGQFWSVFFRMNAYLAGLPNTTPDLSFFLTSMGSAAVGSTMMSLGYQGINDFAEKKDLHSFTINAIQILRDTLFTVCMNRLGIGDTQGFMIMYGVAQGINLGLFLGGKIVNHNTKLIFTSEEILKSEEFKKAYPSALKTEPLQRSSIRKFLDGSMNRMCKLIWKE